MFIFLFSIIFEPMLCPILTKRMEGINMLKQTLCISLIFAVSASVSAATYTYSGTQNAMYQDQAPPATYDTVDFNVQAGYFGTSAARSQTYSNPNIMITELSMNNGWGEAVTTFSADTAFAGSGPFALTTAGLAQDFVFAGDMSGYTGNFSIADFGGRSTSLAGTTSSILQFGGTTAGGTVALGTVVGSGADRYVGNVIGSGSLTANNVVLNFAGDSSYDYIKIENAIEQRDGLHFTGNADYLVSGIVSGGGGLRHSGGGTVTMSGSHTLGGQTLISGGLMKVTGSDGIYRGGYRSTELYIDNGGTLELQNWDYNESTASLGGLRNNTFAFNVDNGTVRMLGTTAYNRGVTVNAGGMTLESAAGADWTIVEDGSTQANWAYNDDPTITLTGAGTGEFQKAITNGTSIVKSGTGTWTLSGANTYTGSTTVEAGTLDVTGSLASAVTVQSGATLTGTGTLGNGLTMNAGSTLSPGASPGTMTLGGDLSLDNANLAIDIWSDAGAGTGHDLITFTSGELTLQNAPTITVNLNNFDPGLDSSYTIIEGYDWLTGAWGDLEVVNAPASWTAANKSFRIDEGSVMLTVIPEPASLGLLGLGALVYILRRRLNG
jgi:autotransporter-associated beta strand protein